MFDVLGIHVGEFFMLCNPVHSEGFTGLNFRDEKIEKFVSFRCSSMSQLVQFD